MRRRGRSIFYGGHQPSGGAWHSTSPAPAKYVGEPRLVISDVPEEWRKYAREPWRILFPEIGANIAADLILTAGLSSIVDSADGADNKYDSVVNISLVPLAPTVAYVPDYERGGNVPVAYPVQQPARKCSKESIETARQARESGFIFNGDC
jgi:hypothetical protein